VLVENECEGGLLNPLAPRILFVGNDLIRLNKSRVVLERGGYVAEVVTPLQAQAALKNRSGYTLLVLPATLSEAEQKLVLAATPSSTQVLRVDHTMNLKALVEKVEDLMRQPSRPTQSRS
jgi:hypothetical protein